MNLTLSPQVERFVQKQVEEGRYRTPADVVAAALERLIQDDGFDFEPGELARLTGEGRQCIERGETVTMSELREHFRKRRSDAAETSK